VSVSEREIVFPHDIESSLSETEGRTLAELANGKIVLELGAWLGRSTVCMAQTAAKLYSVDWHRGDTHAGLTPTLGAYLQNLQRYGLFDQVIPIVGRFEDVLPALRYAHFDGIFLDGCHNYAAVTSDIDQAQRLLAPGGWVAFHDYGVQLSSKGGDQFGVTQVVDEMYPEARIVDTLAIAEA
jgi:predicted O-methyltransferase YrrM